MEAPQTGKYIFETEVDDGIRLWVNDKLIIDKWGESKSSTASGNVMSNLDYSIEKGEIHMKSNVKYSIKVEYYEADKNARSLLFWSSENTKREIVPQSNLFTTKNKSMGDGLNAVYKSEAIWLCYTKNKDNVYIIMLEWPGRELIIDFPEQEKNFKISLLGRDGDIKYSQKDGKLHIDLSNVYHNDLPCKHAWTIKISELK